MVLNHLPTYADQERYSRNATASSIGNFLQCGMADQVQTDAGDAGKKPGQAAVRLVQVDDAYLGGERSDGGRAEVEKPEFCWVNTVLGNLKSALRSSYHSFSPKYAQRYLAEFEYRFNRRYSLPEIIPRLAYVALRTPPMPDKRWFLAYVKW